MHSKTSSVNEIDSDTQPVTQSVQKPKQKRQSKASKAVAAAAAVVAAVVSSEPSASEVIPYSVNCQLLYENSSVHGEVLQCVNDTLTSGLDLEPLDYRQKTRAKVWADGKGLSCFRVFVTASVT